MINKKIALIILIGGCMLTALPAKSAIIFWEYKDGVTFEQLNECNLKTALQILNIGVEIPLDEFSQYFWDEQILSIPRKVCEKNAYLDKLKDLYLKSDEGSIFFSVVIDDSIVFNGLNRTMPVGAKMMPYDDSDYPRITVILSFQSEIWDRLDNMFFRFMLNADTTSGFSIWESTPKGIDIGTLFIKEIYSFFLERNRIMRGRYDVFGFTYTGILQPIGEDKGKVGNWEISELTFSVESKI